jgi:hypothetical protein
MKLILSVFNGIFTIHRLPPDSEIPEQVYEEQFYDISKTDEELSIVCSSSVLLHSEKSETGWLCIKVLGPLNFSLTGILADISDVLVNEEISIYAISTFDTDYILVKSDKLPVAKEALHRAEYIFE